MIKTKRTVLILPVLAALLIAAALFAFVLRPFQVGERPTLVYFYYGR